VTMKFGIKAGSVLASAVFSLVLVAGCNTEEAAPPATSPPAAAPGKPAPAVDKPAAPAVPPATKEEPKK
jgi:hypothetical protein